MWYWGCTATRAFDKTKAKIASHVLCGCEDSAVLRSCCVGKHCMEPSNHDVILLYRTVLHRRYGTTGSLILLYSGFRNSQVY
jgi:hypothetical protein